MAIKAPITATNDSALSAKHQPVPTSTMITPANAGPTMRATWKSALLSPIAFGRSAGPVISDTNESRAGLSIDCATPCTQHDREHHPERDDAGEGEHRQDTGGDPHRRRGEHEEHALVEAVGEHTGPRAEEQRGDELQRDRPRRWRRRCCATGSAPASRARWSASTCRRARCPGRRRTSGSCASATSGTWWTRCRVLSPSVVDAAASRTRQRVGERRALLGRERCDAAGRGTRSCGCGCVRGSRDRRR